MNLAGTLLAATSKSSGSPAFLIVLVGIVAAAYFFFLRPQQQRQKQQRAERSRAEVGDEVLTVGGIVGRVVDVDGDRITIVSGEGVDVPAVAGTSPTRLVLLKQGIARKIEPTVAGEPVQEHEPLDEHERLDDEGLEAGGPEVADQPAPAVEPEAGNTRTEPPGRDRGPRGNRPKGSRGR